MTESSRASEPAPRGLEFSTELSPLARILLVDDSTTILKVVSTILDRNGYETVCVRNGVEALAAIRGAAAFDMVLLDFVMPHMNGYQFCRELRKDSLHGELPVVLMSARTETIGDRFVEQTGAVDALSKPFDARALIAVVGNVLSRVKDGSTSRALLEPNKMLAEIDLDAKPESLPPPSQRPLTLQQLAEELTAAITPHVKKLKQRELSSASAVADAVLRGLDEGCILKLARIVSTLDSEPAPGEILRGDITKVPLAEVLQMLQLQRQTGVLHVENNRKKATLWVREGNLDLVQSHGTGDEFRLGRYFVEEGLASFAQIDTLRADNKQSLLLGELLVNAGKIDAEQLQHVLTKQSCELVYELMRWPKGHFILRDEPFSRAAEEARLDLATSALVLEGFRRVDEWRLMADSIDFNDVLIVDTVALAALPDGKIGKVEAPILEAIDGIRTVREIMEASTLASFDAVSAIYRLQQSRIVRSRRNTNTG